MYEPTKNGSKSVQPAYTKSMFDFFVRAYGDNGWVSFMEIVVSVFAFPLFVQWGDWTSELKCEIETLYYDIHTLSRARRLCE